MNDTNDTQEVATIAAMHTGDYSGVILPEPPAALYARIAELEAALAAVPVEAEDNGQRPYMIIDAVPATAEEVDAILRAAGYDPVQIGKNGKRLAEAWLEMRRWKERAEALEAQLAAVPAYAAYHFGAQLYHDLAEGPAPLSFADWLAAGQQGGKPCEHNTTRHTETPRGS